MGQYWALEGLAEVGAVEEFRPWWNDVTKVTPGIF
jgi:hypothetical protein